MDEQGDSTWQLTAATPVRLQNVPGLVILYVSIVKKQRVVNSALMALNAFASVLVCWGYQRSFGDRMTRFLGRPGISLDQSFSWARLFLGTCPMRPWFISRLCLLRAITLILVAGKDEFSCMDAVWAAQVGPRTNKDREIKVPTKLHRTDAGRFWAALDGMEWFQRTDASLAVLNTHVCTAASLLTWLLLGILFFGKPSVIDRSHAKHDHWSSLCHPSCRSAVPLRLSDEELHHLKWVMARRIGSRSYGRIGAGCNLQLYGP
uniref:Uncharacterized protein n=1 Tax=Salix viminalis TaxID=40686 RepID=A0A6N2KME9_SALVM